MAKGDTKTNQYLDIAANGTRADLPTDTCCETRSQTLIRGVAERIMDVEDEVEEIKNNPDVVDVVPTYAALQNYDTSGLTDKDIIRVLQDETHDGDSTYYRYNAQSGTWTYVGESKQYEDFVGTDGTTAGTAGLVPAPATTDAGKFLKADGTWDTAGSAINVAQAPGTSTTDVMSQKATSEMVFRNPSTKQQVQVGDSANASGSYAVAIGWGASATKEDGIAIGDGAILEGVFGGIALGAGAHTYGSYATAVGTSSAARGNYSIAIGQSTNVKSGGTNSVAIGYNASTNDNASHSVALGDNSNATMKGQVDISTLRTTNTFGYNNSQYRLLTGLYTPQSAHDAVNKEYVDPTTDSSAPTTATVGRLGQIFIDTTNADVYMCVAVDDVTPSYTWKQITA